MPAYKDHGMWFASFYYTDNDGIRKKKLKRGFKLQREALAYERDFLERQEGTPEMTFAALYDLYMADCAARLRPTTYAGKKFLFERHILPYFKAKRINEITPANVRRWQNTLITAKHDEHGTGPAPYTKTYLKTINNQLSAVFNFAVKYYKLPQNPARVCGSMGKKSADAMKFWTLDEFRQFLTAFPDGSPQAVIFSLLFWSGMRSGELLALTPADFDTAAGTVSISKTYSDLCGGIVQDPKTPKSKRVIPLPPFLVEMVAAYLPKLYGLGRHDRIFDVSKYALHKWLRAGCQRSGVALIRVHDLRHSHASLLIDQGFSPLLIRDRLGHENIETTLQTYSHLYPSNTDKLLTCLEKLGKGVQK